MISGESVRAKPESKGKSRALKATRSVAHWLLQALHVFLIGLVLGCILLETVLVMLLTSLGGVRSSFRRLKRRGVFKFSCIKAVFSLLFNQINPQCSSWGCSSKCLLNFLGARFRFASYIDNHMVLQKKPAGAVIWGYGTSGATVTVTLCQHQETIMRKVTAVKSKAAHPLFSFCLLLPSAGVSENESMCSSSGYPFIHPSIKVI